MKYIFIISVAGGFILSLAFVLVRLDYFSTVTENSISRTELKMSCYTFNGKVSCSPESIKEQHEKGNAVVKVGENEALKDAIVIGPKVKLVPWQRVHNLAKEISRDGAKINVLASDKGLSSYCYSIGTARY